MAEKTITVIVEAPDETPPTLEIPVETVYAKVGARVLFTFTAFDERGKADVAVKWSDGALDEYEKLTQGTHTLTVIATDKSGNSTEKTITFIVTSEGDTADVVIDEEALCPDLVEPESSEEPTSSNTPESSEEIASSETPEESELESSQQKQSQENTSMEQSESGCGSALVGSLGMPLMLLGACALFKRKKK